LDRIRSVCLSNLIATIGAVHSDCKSSSSITASKSERCVFASDIKDVIHLHDSKQWLRVFDLLMVKISKISITTASVEVQLGINSTTSIHAHSGATPSPSSTSSLRWSPNPSLRLFTLKITVLNIHLGDTSLHRSLHSNGNGIMTIFQRTTTVTSCITTIRNIILIFVH